MNSRPSSTKTKMQHRAWTSAKLNGLWHWPRRWQND
ncbi:hypothetical protein [Agrobacterium larrymoorei]